MSAPSRIKNTFAERRLFMVRAWLALIVILIMAGGLIARMFWLQIMNHDYYITRSDDNRMRVLTVPPVRGLIHDRNGVVLAENLPAYRLEVVPEQAQDIETTLETLATLVTLNEADIERFHERRKRTPKYMGVPLRLRLSEDELARFEVNRHLLPGVDVRAALSRHYPLGEAGSHVIGYVGSITEEEVKRLDPSRYQGTLSIGKVGVEKSHQDALHGKPGYKIIETNAKGRPLRELEYKRPLPGQNLHLTLDASLQVSAYNALHGVEGAVVALNPKTGGLLAMVSRPGFKPGLFVHGIDHASYKALNEDPNRPLYNRALQGQYPPGSTVKPMMALAGLQYGINTPSTSRYCPGYFRLGNAKRRYRCWKRHGHGSMNLLHAVMQSCDIYFYDLAVELGVDRIHDFASQFGLGKPTGIDLPREKSGVLPSKAWKKKYFNQVWYPGETVSVGIGQGYMTTTPMQLAQMTSNIARRGEVMRPHILKRMENIISGEEKLVEPVMETRIQLADPIYWQKAIDAMHAVVHHPRGTAKRISIDIDYEIAGKTGTSQVIALSQDDKVAPKNEELPKEARDHALFIAFAPVEDPEIVVAVLVEHGGSGSGAAAPVARKVLDAYLRGIPVNIEEEAESEKP